MRRSYKVGRGLAEFEKLPADENRSAPLQVIESVGELGG